MNKLCKILLGITIILTISLIIIIFLLFEFKQKKEYFQDAYVNAATRLIEINTAIETANCELQWLEDGTFILVEQTTE